MMKLLIIMAFSGTLAFASPAKEMNTAFNALVNIIPYTQSFETFSAKENEDLILKNMTTIQSAFKKAKHENLLKQDIFAPSYEMINENITSSIDSFKKGKKSYTHWRIKEITSLCIDCHTRMPTSHVPSFKAEHYSIETTKLTNQYDIGTAQLIVRRYTDARKSFIQSIETEIKAKNEKQIQKAFKQVLLIDLKINKDPQKAKSFIISYQGRKELSASFKNDLTEWLKGIETVLKKGSYRDYFKNEKEVKNFIVGQLVPLEKTSSYDYQHDIQFLEAVGRLYNYLFENPTSPQAPELAFWIGFIEKRLGRESFFSNGDLFLKQCVKRYPKTPSATKCLKEYEESIEFEFTGSSGTHLPPEVLKELEELRGLINKT